jgi:hypothetical protein
MRPIKKGTLKSVPFFIGLAENGSDQMLQTRCGETGAELLDCGGNFGLEASVGWIGNHSVDPLADLDHLLFLEAARGNGGRA